MVTCPILDFTKNTKKKIQVEPWCVCVCQKHTSNFESRNGKSLLNRRKRHPSLSFPHHWKRFQIDDMKLIQLSFISNVERLISRTMFLSNKSSIFLIKVISSFSHAPNKNVSYVAWRGRRSRCRSFSFRDFWDLTTSDKHSRYKRTRARGRSLLWFEQTTSSSRSRGVLLF